MSEETTQTSSNTPLLVKANMSTAMTLSMALHRKAALRDTLIPDVLKSISNNTANLENASLVYGTPEKSTVALDGFRSRFDAYLTELQNLDQRISKTNILTMVEVEVVPGTIVTHTLQYWILRISPHGSLATELIMLNALKDNGLVDKAIQTPTGPAVVKVIRFYDPVARDKKIAALQEERGRIRSAVDNCNTNIPLLPL